MKLVLVWVGRRRDPRWQALQEEYLSRLERFVPVEVVSIKELPDHPGVQAEQQWKELVEKKIPRASTVIALDQQGQQFTSLDFAAFLERLQVRGTRAVSFLVGGANGLPESLRQRADYILSLSRMTWTHEMSRVLLLEQLYRAFTIMRGYPYHK